MPNSSESAKQLALAAARVIADTRGSDIVVLDLRKVTDVFDYFVIATGTSRRQMHAMADEVKHTIAMLRHGYVSSVVRHGRHIRAGGASALLNGVDILKRDILVNPSGDIVFGI